MRSSQCTPTSLQEVAADTSFDQELRARGLPNRFRLCQIYRMQPASLLQCLALTSAMAFGFAPACVDPAEAARPVLTAPRAAHTGRVAYVYDGDTIRVGNRKIRLAAIDAPECEQPYGQQARQRLIAMIHGRTVRIEPVTDDAHGRIVAHVYRDDGLHVNAAMVATGAAWVYRRYASDPSLIALEAAARRGKKGLWALPQDQRMPPEQWRREHETARPATGHRQAC